MKARLDPLRRRGKGCPDCAGQATLVLQALGQDQPSSALEAAQGKLADLERRAENLLKLIDGDEMPPRRLVDQLKQVERDEETTRAQVLDMQAKARVQVSPALPFEQFLEQYGKLDRSKLRAALRTVLERVTVDLPDKTVTLRLRGGGDGEIGLKLVKGEIAEMTLKNLNEIAWS